MGTNAEGGLTPRGRDLLKQMRDLGMILDATHLTDEAFWEALELFDGPVWASHNNCRVLVPHLRQFSDEQLRALIQRNAVIGVACDAWMLAPGWVRGESTPEGSGVTIASLVPHIDHICELAGNSRHVGMGSDLDGGFGREQAPANVDSIADLQSLTTLLADRGYSREDIEGTSCTATGFAAFARSGAEWAMKIARCRLPSGEIAVGRVTDDRFDNLHHDHY